MKKLLSVVLAIALVLGSMAVFAAENPYQVNGSAGTNLKHYGFIEGYPGGDLKENDLLTREQLVLILAELYGQKEEAAAFTTESGYADESKFPAWSKNQISWAKAKGFMTGKPGNIFDNKGSVKAEDLATALLRVLGYSDGVYGQNAERLSKLTGVKIDSEKITRGEAFSWMWPAVSMPITLEEKVLGVEIGKLKELDSLEVTEIKPASIKSISVVFKNVVGSTDKAKLTFEVLRGKTVVPVTVTWDEGNKIALLSNSSNFAETDYDVIVKLDGKDFKDAKVKFTSQKITKIEFTSTSVSVNPQTKNGYVSYKVYDQYDSDITTSHLSNNIIFQVGGAGESKGKNGILTITPASGTQLLQYPTLPISAYETSSGVTASVSLPTITKLGTLSEFMLGSTENIKLVDGDVTSLFYLPYTAKDQSGNETKNYDLITSGLIFSPADSNKLITSLGDKVVAKIVRDPKNGENAVIQINVNDVTADFNVDMPVTVTAMTYTGYSSHANLTIIKAKKVDSIRLYAPSEVVAENERIQIPYEAFDQYGNKIVSYNQIKSAVDLSTSKAEFSEDSNGRAVIYYRAGVKDTQEFLTATVRNTGKISTVQFRVQEMRKPSRIEFRPEIIRRAMEEGAKQYIYVGRGGLRVYDQYNAPMDSISSSYKIKVSTSTQGQNIIKIGKSTNATSDSQFEITNGRLGYIEVLAGNSKATSTLKAELYDVSGTKTLSNSEITFSVVKTSDIDRYNLEGPTKPIYAALSKKALEGTENQNEKQYAAGFSVYGGTDTISGGILLKDKPLKSVIIDNEDEFFVQNAKPDGSTTYGYNAGEVGAKKLDEIKSEASTNITVTVQHNGNTRTLNTTLKSSKIDPVAKDIKVSSKFSFTGSENYNEDTKVFALKVATVDNLNNKSIVTYKATSGEIATEADVVLKILDSYGVLNGMRFSDFTLEKTGSVTASIDKDGLLTVSGSATGDKIKITGIANNGVKQTIVINVISD